MTREEFAKLETDIAIKAIEPMIQSWRFGYCGFRHDFADFLEYTITRTAPGYQAPKWRLRIIAWLLRTI